MTNLRLTGFLILGLALSMGIISWAMHEKQLASVLFVLAALQLLVSVLNWKKDPHHSNPFRKKTDK